MIHPRAGHRDSPGAGARHTHNHQTGKATEMAIAIQKCLKCGRDVTPRDLQSKVTHPRREEFEALGREIGLLSDPDDTVLGATLKLGETLCASCVPDEQLLGVVNEAIDEFLDDPTTCPLLWDWHELNAASMFAEVAS